MNESVIHDLALWETGVIRTQRWEITKILKFDQIGFNFVSQFMYHKNCLDFVICNCEIVEPVSKVKYLGILMYYKYIIKLKYIGFYL